MFEQAGSFMDQIVAEAPSLLNQHGVSLLWTGIALFALRSFVRWGSYH